MTALSHSSAAPEATRGGRFSWALFDWAAQPFFTLVTTFIFAPYFAVVVVGDAITGQSYWGYAQAAAAAAIALMSPVLGAMADAGGPRKPWIATFMLVCAASAGLLWWAVPGLGPGGLALVLCPVAVATIGIEFCIVFNNAMLPTLVSRERLGRLGGFAWALGYLGGLVALAIILLGFTLPETPAFGLRKELFEPERLTGPFAAIWLVVFCIPLFLFTPDTPSAGIRRTAAIRNGLRTLGTTLRSLGRYRNILRYLIARMLYNDGIIAAISFAGIYAKGMFGWSTTELGIFAILLTTVAVIGSIAGGWLDDRLGSKRTITLTVSGLIAGTLGILSVTPDSALFVIAFPTPPAGAGFMQTPAQQVFLGFGLLIGIAFGPAQAASRTMMARLAPPTNMAEFFGLYAFSGKATALLAPLLIAVVTDLANSQRAGFTVILVLFVAGLAVLKGVREERALPPAA